MVGGSLWSFVVTLVTIASPAVVIMLLDYYRKDW